MATEQEQQRDIINGYVAQCFRKAASVEDLETGLTDREFNTILAWHLAKQQKQAIVEVIQTSQEDKSSNNKLDRLAKWATPGTLLTVLIGLVLDKMLNLGVVSMLIAK